MTMNPLTKLYTILQFVETHRGQYHSPQEMGVACSMTKEAVGIALKAAVSEGYVQMHKSFDGTKRSGWLTGKGSKFCAWYETGKAEEFIR